MGAADKKNEQVIKSENKMKVKFKKLSDNAVMPKKAHPTDAGFDLVATSREIDDNGNIVYGTGLAFEIPEGYVGLIYPRSSISKKNIALTNAVGVVDAGYRGEVMAKFKPVPMVGRCIEGMACVGFGEECIHAYAVGDRIAQLIIMPIPDIEFKEADELTATDRGTGGYGSSGK
jgi:dUTP pyrophosphatase